MPAARSTVALAALSLAALAPTKAAHGHASVRAQCTIVPTGSGPEWGLSLRIENGRSPMVLRYFSPLMLRDFTVRLARSPLSLAQPAIDMPVQPQTLRLPPRGRATVPVIIRLRFRPTSGPLLSADRFVQTIDHAPARVQIEGVFGEGPGAIRCTGTLDPSGAAVP